MELFVLIAGSITTLILFILAAWLLLRGEKKEKGKKSTKKPNEGAWFDYGYCLLIMVLPLAFFASTSWYGVIGATAYIVDFLKSPMHIAVSLLTLAVLTIFGLSSISVLANSWEVRKKDISQRDYSPMAESIFLALSGAFFGGVLSLTVFFTSLVYPA